MSSVAKFALKHSLDLFPRAAQERLGRFILNNARNENNDDPEENGEFDLLSRLAAMPVPAPIIFDVGANRGSWSQRASTLFSDAKIYAFEPSRQTFETLTKSVTAIRPFCIGLHDSDSNALLYKTAEGAGTNSLYRRTHSHVVVNERLNESVTLMRGEQFCLEHEIRSIFFLKIDTEGNEISVLRGFESLLKSRQARYVQFEYGGCWIDSNHFLKEAFHYLTGFGYALAKILPHGLQPLTQYDPSLDNFAYANYIAACPEDLAKG